MRFSSFYRTTTIVTPNNYTYSSFTPVRHRRPERLTPPADIRKRCECPTRKRSGIPACRPGARAGQVGLCRLRTGLSVTLTGPVAPVRLACFVASIGCSGRQSQWHPASFRATRACTRRLGQEFRRRRCSPTVKKPRPRRTKARVAATLLLVPVNASAGASGSGTATAGAASAATAAGFAHGSASGGAFTISGDGKPGRALRATIRYVRTERRGRIQRSIRRVSDYQHHIVHSADRVVINEPKRCHITTRLVDHDFGQHLC